MLLDDPKIIEYQIRNLMLDGPEPLGFDFIADHLSDYLFRRNPIAKRDLIILARAFVPLLREKRFLDRLRDFYDCECDNPDITELTRACFTCYSPSKSGLHNAEAQNAQTLISQPLGVQKAMARAHIRAQHEALLHSPWPQVIEILCQNPSILERDIIFLSSKRPTLNELLEPILESPWSTRDEIRFALAANPSFSASHAMRCALTLPHAKLLVLKDISELHPVVRRFVEKLIELHG